MTWKLSDVDLGQIWMSPEGDLFKVTAITGDPTVKLTPIDGVSGGSSDETHVISSFNFSGWKKLEPRYSDGS